MDIFKFIEQDYQARKGRATYISYHWYRAVGPDGLTVTFRYPKGGDLKRFKEFVQEQQLVDIQGPFKTRKAAHVG